MAETLLASPLNREAVFRRKRRNDSDGEEMDIDQSFKRTRVQNDSDFTQSTKLNFHQQIDATYKANNSLSTITFNTALGYGKSPETEKNDNQKYKNQDGINTNMKDYEDDIKKKDEEIALLQSNQVKSLLELNKLQQELQTSQQEVKILRKAVVIQDNKCKELTNQNQQLQSMLMQALQQINELENVNRNLIRELNLTREVTTRGYFPPNPPPDVF